MKAMSAREAKNGFGLMIDTARAVVVVVSVEEYQRLSTRADGAEKDERQSGEAQKRCQ